MKFLTSKALKIVFSMVLSLLILSSVQAQAGLPKIYVNRLSPVEGEGPGGFKGVLLTWDFILLNENGQVISDADVDSARVTLQDGDSRDAQVNLTEAPWSVVILVDASINMANANTALKDALQALASSLDQLPNGSSIAILKFDEEPATVLKFSEEKEALQKALQEGITPNKKSKKACLNNGAYEAVSMLSSTSSRRALILLTASTDNCEERQASDVAKFAQENSVQIYAVGIEGQPVNQDQLAQMTGSTGGLVAMKKPDMVDFAFGSIFGPLKSQWQARATLYPTSAGKQSAKLTVVLKDQSSLTSEPMEFLSPRAYNPPPEIKMHGEVLPTFEGVDFSLDIFSQSLIQKMDIFVNNKKTGNSEYSQIDVKIPLDTQNPTYPVNLIVPKLVNGEEYTLVVQAVDTNGAKMQPVVQDFTYEPTGQVRMSIEPFTPDQPEITGHLESANLGNIGKYRVWLVSQCSKQDELPGTKLEVAEGDPYKIKTSSLANGKYFVVAQAINQDNQVVLTYCDEQQPITINKPGWWPTLIKSMSQSPLAIVGISLLACAGIAVLAWELVVWKRRSSRPKPVPIRFPKVVVNAPAPNLDIERSREPHEVVERTIINKLPQARLSGTLPAGSPITAQIVKPIFTIGRSPECDLMIRVDRSAGLSRVHATIKLIGGSFYIEDNGSSYGTKVNDQEIQKGEPAQLEDGAIIQMGPVVRIKFNTDSA